MLKKLFILLLIFSVLVPPAAAQLSADQEYINQKNYQRNKLELVTKKRIIHENKSYSDTDIDTTTYTFEAYARSYSNISTTSLSRAEAKEISEWYIYKGGVRELSDLEFLEIVEDMHAYYQIKEIEDGKNWWRTFGSVTLGLGVAAMVGGASLSAGQSLINAGALATVTGFFITAFNLSPRHYIQPDYALEKIDEYNIQLKRKLALPLTYD